MSKFVILIPSFNERRSLLNILKKIKKFKVQIIDDASSDNTHKFVKDYKNVSIFRNKKNIGYEQSIKKGFDLLKKSNFNYVITMDADGEHSTNNLKKIIKFCKKKNPDLIIGNRFRKNRILESVLSYLFKIRFDIMDPLSGFKVYKLDKLNFILKRNKIKNYFLVDLLINFIKLKMIVNTINIKTNLKPKRSSKVGGFFYVNLKILSCLKFIFINQITRS